MVAGIKVRLLGLAVKRRDIIPCLGLVPLVGEGGVSGRHELTMDTGAATNNRSERRDDGLRQDRHANRNRGQTSFPHRPREHANDHLEQGEGRPGRGRGGRARGDEARGGRGYSGRYQRTNRDDRGDHSGVG